MSSFLSVSDDALMLIFSYADLLELARSVLQLNRHISERFAWPRVLRLLSTSWAPSRWVQTFDNTFPLLLQRRQYAMCEALWTRRPRCRCFETAYYLPRKIFKAATSYYGDQCALSWMFFHRVCLLMPKEDAYRFDCEKKSLFYGHFLMCNRCQKGMISYCEPPAILCGCGVTEESKHYHTMALQPS